MRMTRERIFRKASISVLTVLLICNLSGCMLLPKEQEERKVTLAKADEVQEYTFISPRRMDLEKELDVGCTYRQMEQESLSFNLDDQIVNQVFVQEGDTVKKGDILATLQTEDMTSKIEEGKNTIEQVERSIKQDKQAAEAQKKQLALDYKYKKLSKAEYKRQLADVSDNLNLTLEEKEDEITIQKMRLQEEEELDKNSKILAPMDGTISYLKKDLLNSISKKGVAVFKMINPEKCAFEIFMNDDSKHLKDGQEYTVNCDGKLYTGKLMSIKGDESYVYIRLNKTPTDLEVGTSGTIHFPVDSRKNALVLPIQLIHECEGENFVYVENEKKIKCMKKVTVGVQTTEYAEILSGLTEDDLVIQE